MGWSSEWLLTAQRAAIHRPTATAVIADLHLGFSQARCHGGDALPDCSQPDWLGALEELFTRHACRRLVIAGDLFEDGRRAGCIKAILECLAQWRVELLGVVPGNHDRGLKHLDRRVPVLPEGIDLGTWRVVHGDGELPSQAVILGHVHPCVDFGRGVRAPCYLVHDRCIILPAFSLDAAGVNVLRDRHWFGHDCHVIAGLKVFPFGNVGRLAARTRFSKKRTPFGPKRA